MKTRNAVLDFIELLGEQAALLDHVKEWEVNLESEKEAVIEDSSHDPEENYSMILGIEGEIAVNRSEQSVLLSQRRNLQQIFFDLYHIDPEERCKVKHYATILTLIWECSNAHPEDVKLHNLEKEIRRSTYGYLWRVLWVWPADCGRCLTDMLSDAEEEVGGEA